MGFFKLELKRFYDCFNAAAGFVPAGGIWG